jgi:ankyrin repeat protein
VRTSSTIFWFAIGLQCLGAVALNALYSKHAYLEQRSASGPEILTAPTMPASAADSAPPITEPSLRLSTRPLPSDPVSPPKPEVRDASVTPLMESAGNGNCDEVQRLIQKGARVNALNANGTDALIYAASAGHLDCVLYLLQARARTDTVDSAGDSALSAARQQGHQKIVEAIELAKR